MKLNASTVTLFFLTSVCSACVSVSTWTDLKETLTSASGLISFCPFSIIKPDNLGAKISGSEVILSCAEQKKCIIQGEGIQILVKPSVIRFVVDGFVFKGATNTAILLRGSSHEIRNCIFRDNYSTLGEGGHGGAIRIGPDANVTIADSRFHGNRARSGGAIAHYGLSLTLQDSLFFENLAFRGGGLFISQQTTALELANVKFISNVATETSSGAISAGSLETASLLLDGLASVKGANNGECNGVYYEAADDCIEFLLTVGELPQFVLGDLTEQRNGIRLSRGLTARVIAQAGEPVVFTSSEAAVPESTLPFHKSPDGAAVFQLDDGGFIYVSNSEEPDQLGGVYGLEFDSKGYLRDYRMMLNETSSNCNGGVTPWNTWISCEEVPGGQCWQVDPYGKQAPAETRLGGSEGGEFEAFAFDYRNPSAPSFFVTEDAENGALRRFQPDSDAEFGWDMLQEGGTLDYLEFLPENRFRWTSSLEVGRQSAEDFFRSCEGIAFRDGMLMFVSKMQQELFRLDLDAETYTVETTITSMLEGGGSFGNGPDHLLSTSDGVLYFTEDGGPNPGVFVYDGSKYLALLEANSTTYQSDETTGIAFTPDGKLIFCIQEYGICLQVFRKDGLPFKGRRVLQWKYDLGRR